MHRVLVACLGDLLLTGDLFADAIFVADKIAWDQAGDPPYLAALASAADQSLNLAAYCYLDYLWQRRETLPALHPWAAQAYRELSGMLREASV